MMTCLRLYVEMRSVYTRSAPRFELIDLHWDSFLIIVITSIYFDMALVTGMVGRWPEDLNDSINDSYKYHEQSLPVPITGYQAELAQIFPSPSPASATSSTSNTDELFFDVETSFEAMSHSYLTFEPVVSSVSGNEPIDWRRYDPPAELLQVQDDTSEEIRGILQSSIERIQARHVEEEEQRAATARRQKPLNRTKRASIKPRKDVRLESKICHQQHANATSRLPQAVVWVPWFRQITPD